MSFFWIFIGGGLGSLCRYGISRALPYTSTGFPWATFWTNLLACLVLGLMLGWLNKQSVDNEFSANVKNLALIGFCGGFSTFSTFSNETLQLIKHQQWGIAVLYVGLSLVLGILLVFLGWVLTK